MSKIYESYLTHLNKIKEINEEADLLVVSKRKPVENIIELNEKGHKDFAENYVQEWKDKYEQLESRDIRWHFIGQLQSNKVKYLVGKVDLIHTVDSLKLLKEIDKRANSKEFIQKILLQVSFDKEEGRGGCRPEDLKRLIKESLELPNLELCGLMMVAPIFESCEKPEYYFKKLSGLLHSHKNILGESSKNFSKLSMGMSGDYQEALKSGANLIRIGSAILGSR